MSKELREIAARMRKHLKAIETDVTFKESPYLISRLCLSKDGTPLAVTWNKEQIDEDDSTLARAYLAEHPDDEDEPITARGLRCLGFSSHTHPEGPNFLSINCGYKSLGIGMDGEGCAFISDSKVFTCIPHEMIPKTIGDVRRLCAALGIEIKETS